MDLYRTDRLLDRLGARSRDAVNPDDEITAALAAWTRQIDAGLPSPAGASRLRRRLRRALGGGALALATLMGSSAAAALTGTDIPALSDVGRVVVAWMPGLDPVRDPGSGDVDARTDDRSPRGEGDNRGTMQPVDAPTPGAAPAVHAVHSLPPVAASPVALPEDQAPAAARLDAPAGGAKARTAPSYRALASSMPAPVDLDRSDADEDAAAAPPAALRARGGSAGTVTPHPASQPGTEGGRENTEAPAQAEVSAGQAHRAPVTTSPAKEEAAPSKEEAAPAKEEAAPAKEAAPPKMASASKEASASRSTSPSKARPASSGSSPSSGTQPTTATPTAPGTPPSGGADRAQEATVAPTSPGSQGTPGETVPGTTPATGTGSGQPGSPASAPAQEPAADGSSADADGPAASPPASPHVTGSGPAQQPAGPPATTGPAAAPAEAVDPVEAHAVEVARNPAP